MTGPEARGRGDTARTPAVERWRDWLVARLRGGRVLLVLGAIVLVGCLAARPATNEWTLRDGLAEVGELLGGKGWLGDVATDMLGFRRLLERRDPYPILGPALKEMGVDWDVHHASTHPPTAYLLVAPIAYLPLWLAGQIWCLVGFGLVFLSLRCYGVPWRPALGLALMAPLWRPFSASFQNLTFVWLAGVAVAFRFRDGGGLASGLGLGVASLAKLLPAGLIVYFLRRRAWRAAAGTLAVWGAALALLAPSNPDAFSAFLSASSRENAWATVLRPDNASMYRQAYLQGGRLGLGLLAAYLVGLLVRNRRALLWPARSPIYAFFLYSFIAVAALPISWGYSATPLLPVLGYFALRGRGWQVLIATAVLLAFVAMNPFHPIVWLGTLATSTLFWLRPPPEAAGEPLDRLVPDAEAGGPAGRLRPEPPGPYRCP